MKSGSSSKPCGRLGRHNSEWPSAAAILLADQGLQNQEIADELATLRNWVQKWRKRFAQYAVKTPPPRQETARLVRLQTLEDFPRSGRPPVFSPQARHLVIRVACQEERE